MHSRRLSLGLILACLGGGAAADEPTGSLSHELLKAYPYQAPWVGLPIASYPSVAIYSPTGPNYKARQPSREDLRRLAEAMAERDTRRPALWSWDLPHGSQLQVMGQPDVQKLDIPWAPNALTPDFTLSASGVEGAEGRLEFRVPILTLAR
jgi:hypothetical protein